jgi:hypothetical protein
MDTRSEKYLQAIKENIGFMGSNAGWNSIKEILEKRGILEESNLKKNTNL